MSQELQNQLNQANDNIKGLHAQLEAAKQMFNEAASSALQLRANIVILSRANHEQAQQIHALTTKILELSPPKMNEEIKPIEGGCNAPDPVSE